MYGKDVPTMKKRVAVFKCILRGLCAQQANAACGVGAIVGNGGFAQQRLDDGRAKYLRDLFQFLCRMQMRPGPARIAIFLPRLRMSAACSNSTLDGNLIEIGWNCRACGAWDSDPNGPS